MNLDGLMKTFQESKQGRIIWDSALVVIVSTDLLSSLSIGIGVATVHQHQEVRGWLITKKTFISDPKVGLIVFLVNICRSGYELSYNFAESSDSLFVLVPFATIL